MSGRADAIDELAAQKISRHVELCDAWELPIVILVDTAGAVTYNPDPGALGELDNTAARALLTDAFNVWAATGVVSFAEGALLPEDINAVGIPATPASTATPQAGPSTRPARGTCPR